MIFRTPSLLILVLISLLYYCNAYKLLLLFAMPTKSHAILGEGYVKHLSKAGHEITYITPLPMKNPPPGVRQIDISENNKYMDFEAIFDLSTMISQEVDFHDIRVGIQYHVTFANTTTQIDEVNKLLNDLNQEFDAVIVEWMYTEMFAGLSVVFNCPLIWSVSLEPHFMVLPLIDQLPNPAYTFHHLSRDYGFNFWQRVHELWMMFHICLFRWNLQDQEHQMYKSIYEKLVNKRGRTLPPYEDVKYNGSLILGNSYVSVGEAMTLPQNYKSIAGYHMEKDLEPLPQDLQEIMDNAKYGVIYFSMGSVLRSSRIPDHLKKDILNVFGALNQTVIWKFEEKLLDLPKNVYILPWAPQTSILAHPNCVLFITHGGHLSETEALHFGIPMIGIPLYADQFLNVNRAVQKGFAKKVHFYKDGPSKLNSAIREILGNSSYRERAKEYSFIHHHRPVPPEKELVHWVEHVIKTRGAMHLRSPALHVPWYQKFYLDLAAVILFLCVIIVILFKKGLKICRGYMKEKLL